MPRRNPCVAIGIWLALAVLTPTLASAAPSPLPRVRISEDGAHFVLEGSNTRFVPWGFNYLGKHEHLAEDDWETPEGWQRIATDFRQMKALGANVVRWHLQFETFMDGPDQPDEAQLQRLKKLLEVARSNGLYLDLTGLNSFRRDRIPPWYDALAEADRWSAQAVFWEAVARTCAGDPAVFCYDLINEPIIGAAKPDEHPWVTGELGGFCFVQRICNAPGQRQNTDIAAAWVQTMVAAIRRHDGQTLVTVGVIPWAQVWPTAKPLFYAPEALRHLDFVSIHVYPGPGELEKDRAALAVYDLGKPLVVEEIFPLKCSMEDLDAFIDATSGQVDGWISHYFGATPDEHRAGAKPAGPLVAGFLEYWAKKGREIARPAVPAP